MTGPLAPPTRPGTRAWHRRPGVGTNTKEGRRRLRGRGWPTIGAGIKSLQRQMRPRASARARARSRPFCHRPPWAAWGRRGRRLGLGARHISKHRVAATFIQQEHVGALYVQVDLPSRRRGTAAVRPDAAASELGITCTRPNLRDSGAGARGGGGARACPASWSACNPLATQRAMWMRCSGCRLLLSFAPGPGSSALARDTCTRGALVPLIHGSALGRR